MEEVAVVQVDCDTDTGEVKVEKVWLAHDIGRAINPLLVEGQIEGGVYMGLGEALFEEQAFRGALHRRRSQLRRGRARSARRLGGTPALNRALTPRRADRMLRRRAGVYRG